MFVHDYLTYAFFFVGISTRSVADETLIPQQSRIIRQDGEEVATQSSTACPVTAAVHSCSVCGKHLGSAYSLR
jgi:peptide methionine sulfoxide reductase MsrB